ncbi:FHA domain-containing protein [Butyrivibrio sp. ob235]|uniref:DUF6382 domain-containing protein n=1 Tax=Butyrivibrio sp. ob235 TaxID=1761780 RepID=UPI0008B5322B|nr:DUF6382 domain-containing protein [Butyrivibrio sp. ob235]SEL66467.1 FHA domain-containing protein [Butyrivibrio sp. ob235]
MDIQYYKDAKHNYLILEAEVNEDNIFQYKMLENNKIDGLLPFSLRNTDECYYLYYEIDSRQSIKNRYDRKKMSYEKLKRFLSDMVITAKNLGDFLLDPSHIILLPEAVFEDFSTGRFYFIYDPVHEKTIDHAFFEGLMEYADLEDGRCSQLIFELLDTICDASGIDFSVLERAVRAEPEEAFMEEMSTIHTSKDIYETRINANEKKESFEMNDDEDFEDDEDEAEAKDKSVTEKKIKIMLPLGVNFLMAMLFAIIAGALWYLRYAYILTYEENILDIAVFMISVMMSLSCFILQLRKNTKVFGNKVKEPVPESTTDMDKNVEAPPSDLVEMPLYSADNKAGYIRKRAYEHNVLAQTDEDEENEETVLLSFDFEEKLHKLYAEEGTGLDNIGLQKLPMVVGKLSSCADAVIKDKSVSRMHARLFREDRKTNSLWIQDLNSTNGTFVNGRRLMPNEKVELFEDDEVSFGKCVYAYR